MTEGHTVHRAAQRQTRFFSAEPEDELKADATMDEPQDPDPPRNEPNPIV